MSKRIKNIAEHRQDGNDLPFFQVLKTVNADVENTTAAIDAVKITIPADEWKDGETIFIYVRATSAQDSAAAINITERLYYGSQLFYQQTGSVANAAGVETGWSKIYSFTRVGSTIWYSTRSYAKNTFSTTLTATIITTGTYKVDALTSKEGRRTAQSFNTQKDLILNLQWATADPNAYVRIEQSMAYKIGGQL